MMSTNIVALPEDEFGDDEAGDNAPQCYLVDNHPHRADRWRFHRPSHVAATGSSQQDHFLTSSFHELIHYAIFSEHPSTNNNEIMAIRGGGSTSTAATNDHHAETVNNFLDEGTASFSFAADRTAALVATTTTTTTDDLISTNYCDDYPDLDNYLNGGSELLDFDSDSLLHLQDSSTTATPSFWGQDDWGGDSSAQQQLREYTLREWITASLRTEMHVNNNNNQNMKALSSVQPKELPRKYIMSALMIALKLTECILEAEKDEQRGCRNPIPLESIAPKNVLIRARKCRHISNGGDEKYKENEAHDEMIEFVWVMSFVGEKSATGTVMSRLFAMGRLLYEILSSHEPQTQEVDSISFMNSVNLGGIDEDGRDHRPQKRSYRRSAHPADDDISNLITRLESMGVPWSLCLLMKNLLDCQHGSLSEDDAYTSFTDLLLDLKLMVEDPSCFLDNCTTKLAIQNKLYGRDYEMNKVEELYQHHVKEENKEVNGIIISGAAGVGKSTLAKYLQVLTSQSNRYFVTAKFEHNQMSLKPLSTLSNMFDTLCGVISENSSRTQLMTIEEELTRAIGSESYLLGILPSLRTLMPSSVLLEASSTNDCVDSTISMRFLFAEVMRVLSTHSKPITLLIDDIQYADHTSLLLVAGLLFSANQTSVFFAFCHRDDEANKSGPFRTWLASISILSLETIHLEPVLPEVVNDLISETLHLSPRMTRPLSSVLYHKTRGNPLFLKQLLISLTEQGYIYFDWNQHRWAWELDKIMELKISDSVLALLMDDIERLPDDMKFGLQVASCIGSQMTEFMLACLSKELGFDLKDILRQLSQKGFMIDIAGSAMFRFAHDRIQQAAYEMMPNHVRNKNHMRFGLALCNHTLNNGVENEELFFAAVSQINQGGPTAVQESSETSVFAELNLRAGRRSIDLSDYNTAFMMFQHGLLFLGEDSWTSNYRLSLELHDSLTEVAMILNKPSTVEVYTEKVISHARCFDDKLHCLCTSVQALAVALEMDKSIQSSFGILFQFGEELPRDMTDAKLQTDIDRMTFILQSTSDELIFNMQENNDKKLTALFNLYVYLAHALLYFQPWLFGSVSLRMMEITMKTGLCTMSPLAFAHFGSLAVTIGYVTVGCRLGKIALKLLERKGSSQYKSKVISFVYDGILWAAEPLQSIVDSHLQGYKTGQLSGDIIYGLKNVLLAITTGYVAGQNLDVLQKNIVDFVRNLQRHGVKLFMKLAMLLLSQIMVLKDGLHMSRTSHLEDMPTEVEILADASSAQKVFVYGKVHHLSRAVLFRQIEDGAMHINISHAVAESYHQLDSIILLGYFFEGLASFLFVRRSMMNSSCIDGNESSSMMERGLSVLKRMRCWSEHSCWNWEDKRLLLEAEHMYTLGEYDRASSLYDSAIRSAHDHKFLHGEAIASELTGIFYHERGLHSESYPYLVHSVSSYKEWGAHAISERVEILLRDAVFTNAATVANTGGTLDILRQDQLSTITDSSARTSLGHLFSLSQGCKKKRDEAWEP